VGNNFLVGDETPIPAFPRGGKGTGVWQMCKGIFISAIDLPSVRKVLRFAIFSLRFAGLQKGFGRNDTPIPACPRGGRRRECRMCKSIFISAIDLPSERKVPRFAIFSLRFAGLQKGFGRNDTPIPAFPCGGEGDGGVWDVFMKNL